MNSFKLWRQLRAPGHPTGSRAASTPMRVGRRGGDSAPHSRAAESPPRAWGFGAIRSRSSIRFDSSPRAWGGGRRAGRGDRAHRGIPTCVGRRGRDSAPHSRAAESPPRAWGAGSALRPCSLAQRATPTRVGRGPTVVGHPLVGPGHPHGRGTEDRGGPGCVLGSRHPHVGGACISSRCRSSPIRGHPHAQWGSHVSSLFCLAASGPLPRRWAAANVVPSHREILGSLPRRWAAPVSVTGRSAMRGSLPRRWAGCSRTSCCSLASRSAPCWRCARLGSRALRAVRRSAERRGCCGARVGPRSIGRRGSRSRPPRCCPRAPPTRRW
jgi:hypothetical protein